MNHRLVFSALGLAFAQTAVAAPPKTVFVDHSSPAIMPPATAAAVMAQGITPRVLKLYPASKWGFVSQVEGGLTANKTCVITARVMMMQLTPTLKAMLFRPAKTATAFDALPNASADQCKELAKSKLEEAVKGVASSLAKS